MAQDNIGFIGIGNMGYHMAGHLRKKMPSSATLYINDVVPESCDRFVKEFGNLGPVVVASSAREAADNAQAVFSIVPMPKHVRSVYLDPETGIIAASKNVDRILLECSTIDIDTTREVGKTISEAGRGTYVDSPVSGGAFGAQAASISFLIGYPESGPAVSRIKALVSPMGPPGKVNFCGELGTGLASKISNNYLSCAGMLMLAEAMAIGIRYGVDRKVLYNCMRVSTGASWILDNMQPCPGVIEHAPSSNAFAPSFKPFMIVKDVSLAVDAAKKVGIDATMGETALKAFKKSDEDPRTKDLDCTSVWLHVNQELK